MKLKFVADAYYNEKHVFEKGKTYEVNDDLGYASRWIRRGVAVKILDETPIVPDHDKQDIEQAKEKKQDIVDMGLNKKPRKFKKSLGHQDL
jgi:hypothetical protein